MNRNMNLNEAQRKLVFFESSTHRGWTRTVSWTRRKALANVHNCSGSNFIRIPLRLRLFLWSVLQIRFEPHFAWLVFVDELSNHLKKFIEKIQMKFVCSNLPANTTTSTKPLLCYSCLWKKNWVEGAWGCCFSWGPWQGRQAKQILHPSLLEWNHHWHCLQTLFHWFREENIPSFHKLIQIGSF